MYKKYKKRGGYYEMKVIKTTHLNNEFYFVFIILNLMKKSAQP